MASITVTGTNSGTGTANGITLALRVLTGAVEWGGASWGNMAVQTGQASVTPAFSTSLVLFALQNATNTSTFTAATNNSFIDNAALGADYAYADGTYTGTVTAGSAITVGSSAPTGDTIGVAIWEAHPLVAGSAPATDASTPATATASGALTVTTASFSPPAGAVLVALITANGTGTGGTISMAVTSTGGLTWTQRALGTTNGDGMATIFTATMPTLVAGDGIPSPSVIVPFAAGRQGAGHAI